MLHTEFAFTLPCGYVDERGTLHRDGLMRRATALDEIEALGHPRARANELYAPVLLLSRVVLRLGDLEALTPAQVEGLFASDFAYLQELYMRINGATPELVQTRCPACGTRILLNVSDDGRQE
jgi:hypothetical protein